MQTREGGSPKWEVQAWNAGPLTFWSIDFSRLCVSAFDQDLCVPHIHAVDLYVLDAWLFGCWSNMMRFHIDAAQDFALKNNMEFTQTWDLNPGLES